MSRSWTKMSWHFERTVESIPKSRGACQWYGNRKEQDSSCLALYWLEDTMLLLSSKMFLLGLTAGSCCCWLNCRVQSFQQTYRSLSGEGIYSKIPRRLATWICNTSSLTSKLDMAFWCIRASPVIHGIIGELNLWIPDLRIWGWNVRLRQSLFAGHPHKSYMFKPNVESLN